MPNFVKLNEVEVKALEKNPTQYNGEVLEQPQSEGARKLYIESYGCQMNFSDSEIVASILSKEGFSTTTH
jgi:2-methylthioadenine synthetase